MAIVAGGILVAIGCIAVAIAKNLGFFTAPASPGWKLAAAGFTAVAFVTLIQFDKSVREYYVCMGSPEACGWEFSQLNIAMTALIVVLSIQVVACNGAAGVAAIPFVGAAPMIAITSTLTFQLTLLPALYLLLTSLVSCATDEAAKPVVPVIVGGAVVVAALTAGVTLYMRRRLPWRWQPPQ